MQALDPHNLRKTNHNELTEVMIRFKAIAINPADFKMIEEGHRLTSWHLVPGLYGYGVMEDIGDKVKKFPIGGKVLPIFAAGDRGGPYQQLSVVQETTVAKMPVTWSFEDAATLGVCYLTGVISLGIDLKTSLPLLKDGPTIGFNPSSILILGAISALGLAYNHSHITKTLGASKAFDRNSASLIMDLESESPGSRGVDAIIDAASAGGIQRHIFGVCDPSGPKGYAQVWTGDEEIEVPSGVDSVMFRARDLSQLHGGKNVMLALLTLSKEKRLPLPEHKVGDGFDALENGLELMRNDVGGKKFVVAV